MKKSLFAVFVLCILLSGCGSTSSVSVEQTTSATYDQPSHIVTSQGCQGLRDQLAGQLSYAHAIRADLNDPAALDQSEEVVVRLTMGKLQHQIGLIQTELNNCLKQGN